MEVPEWIKEWEERLKELFPECKVRGNFSYREFLYFIAVEIRTGKDWHEWRIEIDPYNIDPDSMIGVEADFRIAVDNFLGNKRC